MRTRTDAAVLNNRRALTHCQLYCFLPPKK